MKFLGKGVIRSVYIGKDKTRVIKVIHSDYGFEQNIHEMLVYQRASDELRAYLCEPYEIFFDGLVMTMERGKPIERKEIPKAPKIIRDHDNKVENWVKVNGIYKRCDYHQLIDYV